MTKGRLSECPFNGQIQGRYVETGHICHHAVESAASVLHHQEQQWLSIKAAMLFVAGVCSPTLTLFMCL